MNEFVDYHHFKMDTFQTALKLIQPGCFMASVDLKDAYYSIPSYTSAPRTQEISYVRMGGQILPVHLPP